MSPRTLAGFVSWRSILHRSRSSRLVGYSILAIGITLAAGGLWLGSWGVLLCVALAFAIIGAVQLACRLVVGACLTSLALGMAIVSTASRRLISRPTFR